MTTNGQTYEDGYGEVQEGAMVRREGFGSTELAPVGETAAAAMAKRSEAAVQARHVMARKFPRVFDDVRTAVLKECRRPMFAAVVRYRKPQGRKRNESTNQWEQNFIEGPSIRFVEIAIQKMGNIEPRADVIYEDDRKRILHCEVLDYETNTAWSADVTVEKSVERRELKGNQKPLAVRQNSYGDTVFIVPANDDEITNKQNNLVSKAMRTLGLRLVPRDLVDEAMEAAIETLKKEDKKDPDAARKRVIDNFAGLGVKAADLAEYLGHPVDAISPDELLELRAIGATIAQGDARWSEVLEASPYRKAPEGEGEKPNAAAAGVRAKVEEKINAAKAKRAGPRAEPAGGGGAQRPAVDRDPREDGEPEPGSDG